MAQNGDDAVSIRHEHWVFGVLASGGSGLFDRDNVQFVRAGVRVGRVMTGELGQGWLRGTFEVDVEVMPRRFCSVGRLQERLWLRRESGGDEVELYPRQESDSVFSGAGRNAVAPTKIPPGDTSKINFTSGAGVGLNYFLRPGRSVNFDLRATHLSNASLGDHNPGVNSSLQFAVGYNWWKQ